MMQLQKLLKSIILSTLAIYLNSCREDTPVFQPNQEKLFGNWEWVQSCERWNDDKIITPVTENYTMEKEFLKNGIYKSFKNNDLVQKNKFKFTAEEYISATNGKTYLMNIYDVGLLHKNNEKVISFTFKGSDTVIMETLNYDGISQTFVRKN